MKRVAAAMLAVLLAAAGVAAGSTMAQAAPAAPVGHYSGTISGGGRTVGFDLGADGTISRFTANVYIYCGTSVQPVPWPWDGNTPIPVSDDGTWNRTWQLDVDTDMYYQVHEEGTVAADGTASGTNKLTLYWGGSVFCSGETARWTAAVDGGVVYDPQLAAAPSSLTVSQLADTGVALQGTGYPGSTPVTITFDGSNTATATTTAAGTFSTTVTVTGAAPGVHTIAATDGTNSATTSVTVTDDPIVYTPEASVIPSTLTKSDLAGTGVVVNGTGFPADTAVQLTIDGDAAGTGTTGADGSVSFPAFTSTTLGIGAHPVLLTAGVLSATATFTVTDDPIVYDPHVAVSPEELTVSELAGTGVETSGSGFAPNAAISFSVDGQAVETASANASGEVAFTFTSGALAIGTHTAKLASAEGDATASFTVLADPTYTPTATVAPTTLTVTELAGTGVTITAAGFPANTDVALEIDGTSIGSTRSDGSGGAVFAYTSDSLGEGSHTVRLTAGAPGATAAAGFTVTADVTPPAAQIPTAAPGADALVPGLEGGITTPASAALGETITLSVPGAAPGTEVGVWLFGAPVYLGTHTVSAAGTVTATISGVSSGTARLGIWSASDGLLGWAPITVTEADSSGPGGPAGPGNSGEEPSTEPDLAHTGGGDVTLPLALGTILAAGGLFFLLARRRKSAR